MRNPNLVSYETIVRATNGKPEAIDEVLQHYSKRIRIASFENGHVSKDTEDNIKRRLIAALFQFRFDGQATQQEVRFVGKIVILTFNDTEEKAVEKAIAAFADMISLEALQPPQSPALVFPGLEIRLHQRRVLKDGADIYLTRLEYGALCCLAASPGRYSQRRKFLKPYGSWKAKAASQMWQA